MNWQAADRREIFAKHISNKGTGNIYRTLSSEKTTQLKNGQKFSKENTQISRKHVKSWLTTYVISSVQFGSVAQSSSVTQSCPTLCDSMDHSTPGLPVHHQLLEFTQTHVYRVSDALPPSYPLLSPSPPALNLSQHQGLLKWGSCSHQVAKGLEFQLQHHSF